MSSILCRYPLNCKSKSNICPLTKRFLSYHCLSLPSADNHPFVRHQALLKYQPTHLERVAYIPCFADRTQIGVIVDRVFRVICSCKSFILLSLLFPLFLRQIILSDPWSLSVDIGPSDDSIKWLIFVCLKIEESISITRL